MKERIIAAVEGDQYVWRKGDQVLGSRPVSELDPKKLKRALKANKDWEQP